MTPTQGIVNFFEVIEGGCHWVSKGRGISECIRVFAFVVRYFMIRQIEHTLLVCHDPGGRALGVPGAGGPVFIEVRMEVRRGTGRLWCLLVRSVTSGREANLVR